MSKRASIFLSQKQKGRFHFHVTFLRVENLPVESGKVIVEWKRKSTELITQSTSSLGVKNKEGKWSEEKHTISATLMKDPKTDTFIARSVYFVIKEITNSLLKKKKKLTSSLKVNLSDLVRHDGSQEVCLTFESEDKKDPSKPNLYLKVVAEWPKGLNNTEPGARDSVLDDTLTQNVEEHTSDPYGSDEEEEKSNDTSPRPKDRTENEQKQDDSSMKSSSTASLKDKDTPTLSLTGVPTSAPGSASPRSPRKDNSSPRKERGESTKSVKKTSSHKMDKANLTTSGGSSSDANKELLIKIEVLKEEKESLKTKNEKLEKQLRELQKKQKQAEESSNATASGGPGTTVNASSGNAVDSRQGTKNGVSEEQMKEIQAMKVKIEKMKVELMQVHQQNQTLQSQSGKGLKDLNLSVELLYPAVSSAFIVFFVFFILRILQ